MWLFKVYCDKIQTNDTMFSEFEGDVERFTMVKQNCHNFI